jgi:hypothetical protein
MKENDVMTTSSVCLLPAKWRERAGWLDEYALALRREGYVTEAADAEQEASDYRSVAGQFEIEARA